jgi:hypothetical protein
VAVESVGTCLIAAKYFLGSTGRPFPGSWQAVFGADGDVYIARIRDSNRQPVHESEHLLHNFSLCIVGRVGRGA